MAARALDRLPEQAVVGWWGKRVRLVMLEAESENEESQVGASHVGAHGCVQHLTWQLMLVLVLSVGIWAGVVWLIAQAVQLA